MNEAESIPMGKNPHYKPPVMRWNVVEVVACEGTECGIAIDVDGYLSIIVRRAGEPWPLECVVGGCATIGPGERVYRVENDERGPAVGHESDPDPITGECIKCKG